MWAQRKGTRKMEIHNRATFIELSWSSPDQTHHLVSLLQPASGTPHIFSQTLQCCILFQINLWDYCSPCSASLTVCKKKTFKLTSSSSSAVRPFAWTPLNYHRWTGYVTKACFDSRSQYFKHANCRCHWATNKTLVRPLSDPWECRVIEVSVM